VIFNTDPNSLFKLPPLLGRVWREKLGEWLKLVGGSYEPVFSLQLRMLDEIVALENDIAERRRQAKTLRAQIPRLKAEGKLDQIRTTQQASMEAQNEAEVLLYTRQCILMVGDTIAAKMLDPDTIKQFAAYQSAGFLSGKEGLHAEIEAAKHFHRKGYMVILNDLTNSLRLGDLTLKKDGETRTFEVKTSAEAYSSPDAVRQIVLPIQIHRSLRPMSAPQ
jgi:hypothetical protein